MTSRRLARLRVWLQVARGARRTVVPALLGPCSVAPGWAHVGSAPPGFGSGSVGVLFDAGHLLPVVAAALLLAQWLATHPAAVAGAATKGQPRGQPRPDAVRPRAALSRLVAGPLLAFGAGAAFGLALIASGRLEFDLVAWPGLATALAGGLMVAWARPWPGLAVLVAVAALGLGFGLAALLPSALLVPGAAPMWPWLLGLWCGGCGWLLIVAGFVHTLLRLARAAWAGIGVRVLGSWIAASSAIVLALALAPLAPLSR